MTQQFKLAISPRVTFTVKATMQDGTEGSSKAVKVVFNSKRITGEEWEQKSITMKARQIVAEYVDGWTEQNIVLTGDDAPAEFGPEALAYMLSAVPNFAELVCGRLVHASGATAKN